MRNLDLRKAAGVVALTAVAAMALTACSTYSGRKIGDFKDAAGVARHVAPGGVPYTLIKPELRLTLTPATTADGQNTVTVDWVGVADPYQRYAVHLNPSPLANPDFKIAFTTNGTVTTTTSTVTEQITPTLKALGSFVVSLASAGVVHSAKVAGPADMIADLQAEIGAQPINGPCGARWDFLDDLRGVQPQRLNPKWPANMTVGEALQLRIADYKSDAEMQGALHYLTVGELNCLRALPQTFQAFAQALATYGQKYPTAESTALTRELKYEVTQGQITAKPDQKQWPAATPQQTVDQKVLIQAAQDALSTTDGYVDSLIAMSPAQWRARHVVFTEAELGRIELMRLQRLGISPGQDRILDAYEGFLRMQRAEAIGAAELYARSAPLENYLAVVRNKDVRGGVAPASAAYAQYRGELDTLRAAIEAKRTATLAALTPPPAPKAQTLPTLANEPTCWLASEDFDPAKPDDVKSRCSASRGPLQVGADGRLPKDHPGALRRQLDAPPPFVIVLENP